MVASAFGIPQEGCDKATLLRRFETFLADHQRHGKRVLLLIDEAQNLPPRSVEELRMLSNFQINNHPALQIYLIGQPEFRQILAHESLEQLRQRIIATYHLVAMDAAETRAYIEHRLRTVNWQGDPKITDAAFAKVFEATGGVPRRINTLCTRLLLMGELDETHEIDADLVEEVIKELQVEGATPASAYRGGGLNPVMSAGSGSAGGSTPTSAASAAAAPGVSLAEFNKLDTRIAALEKSVGNHDRAIRRLVDLISKQIETTDDERVLEPVASG
jgi:hypothetical protein